MRVLAARIAKAPAGPDSAKNSRPPSSSVCGPLSSSMDAASPSSLIQRVRTSLWICISSDTDWHALSLPAAEGKWIGSGARLSVDDLHPEAGRVQRRVLGQGDRAPLVDAMRAPQHR